MGYSDSWFDNDSPSQKAMTLRHAELELVAVDAESMLLPA